MWGAVALCAARPLTVAAERGAWTFLAASLAVWAAADLSWTLHFNHVENPPYPNCADVLYLAVLSAHLRRPGDAAACTPADAPRVALA